MRAQALASSARLPVTTAIGGTDSFARSSFNLDTFPLFLVLVDVLYLSPLSLILASLNPHRSAFFTTP